MGQSAKDTGGEIRAQRPARATKPSWGDVNARLNRLVREGEIAGFRTNLGQAADVAELEIVVTSDAEPQAGQEQRDDVRSRVVAAMAGLVPDSAIRVEPR